MSFDLEKILASKRAFRHGLAARDITEKLQMLEDLRDRALALRASRLPAADANVLREDAAEYPVRQDPNL